MSERPTQHTTFSIERGLDSSPPQVFKAWSDPAIKGRWFVGPPGNWKMKIREFDFRIGGRERLVGEWPDGRVSTFDARYQDIVPERRIIYSYDMYIDKTKISISIATVDFMPEGNGTRMRFTEQTAFLNGLDNAGARKKGTGALLDQFEAVLQGKPVG